VAAGWGRRALTGPHEAFGGGPGVAWHWRRAGWGGVTSVWARRWDPRHLGGAGSSG
jgi:hypothetical protein